MNGLQCPFTAGDPDHQQHLPPQGRVILLQIALVLSGVVFMMVVAVRDSAQYTFNDLLFTILNANITMVFKDPERIDYVEKLTLDYPGVKPVEMWGFGGGTIRPRGQEATDDDESVQLFGVPLPTQSYGYQLRGGSLAGAERQFAIVLEHQASRRSRRQGGRLGDGALQRKERARLPSRRAGVRSAADHRRAGGARQAAARPGPGGPLGDGLDPDRQEGLAYEQAIAKGLRQYYEANDVQVSSQRGIFGGSAAKAPPKPATPSSASSTSCWCCWG